MNLLEEQQKMKDKNERRRLKACLSRQRARHVIIYDQDMPEYVQMLREQGRRCAMCNRKFTTNRLKPVVDCNKVGKVMALLCRKCLKYSKFVNRSEIICSKTILYLTHYQQHGNW